MPFYLDNRHQQYIVALVQFEFVYILHMHRQQIQANICKWLHDYRHDIECLEHNYMDPGNVHLHKPDGMDSLDLMNIRVVRMQSMDYHDNRPSNSNAHDDYNLVCKWHFVHS